TTALAVVGRSPHSRRSQGRTRWDERPTRARRCARRLVRAADAGRRPQLRRWRHLRDQLGTRRGERLMRKAVHEMATEIEVGDIHTKGEDWGGQLVRHIDLPPGADFTPLFVGLPGDVCQCPHWGYIVEGSIHVRYADGSEDVNRAGDLYYWPGGHTA